jgi:hypothetical protein
LQPGIWAYRDMTLGGLDLAGYEVHATDGLVGRVEQVVHDEGGSHVVIARSPGLDLLAAVPAGFVERVEVRNRRLVVDRTKEEIESAPAYDRDRGLDDVNRAALERHYGARRMEGTALRGEVAR